MNIKNYLKDWKKRIDRKLIEYLPDENSYPPTLSKSMSYTVLAGGKRIRPILLLTTYKLCGGKDIDNVYPIACALELIHSYSLIHDDLPAIDNDNLRRGVPTLHRRFGEDIAILAGDALFSHAFSLIAESDISPYFKENVLKTLTKAIGNEGIIGGQVKDVESNREILSPKILRYIHSHKTAYFFSAACKIGGILADADREKLYNLEKGGLFMGMTFQIVDDLLDIEGKKEETGKDINRDSNKLTYPSLYGIEKSRRIAERYSKIAIKHLKQIDNRDRILEEIIMLLLDRTK